LSYFFLKSIAKGKTVFVILFLKSIAKGKTVFAILFSKKYIIMKTYHKFFVFLKFLIVLIFILSKFHVSNFSHKLEKLVENIFAIYVGVVVIFVFWPWTERNIDIHDKMLVLSAGTLLLLTKNYYKLYNEFITILKNLFMSIEIPQYSYLN
jgi:hypothetical protein